MTGVARITKLDFFIMKSQGISYLSLVAVILLFGLMGSSITVLCITGAWFIALMATNIFAIQEKNHLDRLYGSVCVSLNEVVLGRYTFVFLNYFTSMVVIIILYLGFVLCRKATFDVPDIMLGLGLSFLVFSTITGIQMPLFFKMGYTKAKLWSVIPFAVVMLLVVLPSFVSALSGIEKDQSFLRENSGLCNSANGNAHCLVKGRGLWYSYGSKGTGCKELCVILGVCDGKEI